MTISVSFFVINRYKSHESANRALVKAIFEALKILEM